MNASRAVASVAVLAVFTGLGALRQRGTLSHPNYLRLLCVLVAVATVAWIGMLRVHGETGRVHLHPWDVFHYYVGTKYFPSLGYTGLYEAAVIADWEDDRAHFVGRQAIRDLTGRAEHVARRAVVARRDAIVARFGDPERWRAFKRDVAFFREADPEKWRSSTVLWDHGYNGTPLVTALLGGLARQPFVSTETFLGAAIWLDAVLVALLALAVWRLLGAETALVFSLFWLFNPLNDYEYVGGAYLRTLYFVALAFGLALFRSGRLATSGVAFAGAALLRLFPAFFPLALLAHDLLGPDRVTRLRAHARFFVAGAAGVAGLLAATSWLPSPDEGNPWLGSARRLSVLETTSGPNELSLRYPFTYSERHNLDRVLEAGRSTPLDWQREIRETLASRRPYHLAALGVLLALTVAYLRRTRAEESFFAGICAIFGLLALSHYYFAVLSLLPLIFHGDRRPVLVAAGGLAAIAATFQLEARSAPLDLQYAVYSAEVGVLLAALLLLKIAWPRAGDAASGAAR